MIAWWRGRRCRAIAPLLVDAAEKSVSAAGAARVERHLRDCAECREALAALRTLPALLREEPEPTPPDSWERQRQDILRAVRNASAERPAAVPGWQVVAAMSAVACVAAIGAALLRDPSPRAMDLVSLERAAAADPRLVSDVLELVAWETEGWEVASEVAVEELLEDAARRPDTAEGGATSAAADLRDEEVDDLDDLVGEWLAS